uniref:Keratin 222 n=1 Tax=Hippocampus comes TaxID=109280 RepID=A0A3Q3D375_HIPCM
MELSKLLDQIRAQCNLNRPPNQNERHLTWTQVSLGSNALREAWADLAEARKQWHSLQVEIETLHALEKGLENSLHNTQQLYSSQLQELSQVITGLEGELEQVRNGLATQRQRHSQMLNTKIRLEREISTYRRLLEQEEGRSGMRGTEDEQDKHLPISTVKTQEILQGSVVQESAEGHGTVETEKIDKVIKQWESSFFKGNPKLRKKSVSLRFDLHMAAADEGCAQTRQDSLPDVEVRLIMKRSRSSATITP